MRYNRERASSAVQTALVISSLAKYASAAAISASSASSLSSFTIPSSTATTYDGATLSVLPSATGIVVNSTKTVSFSGTSSNAVYTLAGGCVMSAVKQDGSVVFIPGTSCPAVTATSSKTGTSSGSRSSSSVSSSINRSSTTSATKSSVASSGSSSGSSKASSASSSRVSSSISSSKASSSGSQSSSKSSSTGSGVQSSRSSSSQTVTGTASSSRSSSSKALSSGNNSSSKSSSTSQITTGTESSSRSSSSGTNSQSSKSSSGTAVSSSRSSVSGTGVASNSTSIKSSISQSKSSTSTSLSPGTGVSSSSSKSESASKSGSSGSSSASKSGTEISSSGSATPSKTSSSVSSSSSSKADASSTKTDASTSQKSSSKSSSGSSTAPQSTVTLGIITSVIVSGGSTIREPILTGPGLSTPITLPPITTTYASSQATSAVSSVSSQIIGLIPVLSSWKANPTPLKTDTLNKVNDLKNSVENLISDLGSDSSNKGCGSAKRRKRGLLGLIGDVVNSLTCITKDLDNIKDNVNTDDVDGIETSIDDLQGETDDLTDDNDDNTSTDQKSTTDSKSESSKTSSSSSSSKSDSSSSSSSKSSSSSCSKTETALHVTELCQPTVFTTGGSTVSTLTCTSSITGTVSGCSVTAATTTISSSSSSATQTPCASDTCNGACPIAPAALSGVSMGIIATTEACSQISTSKTSALPTASYGVLGSIPVAQPTSESSKRSSYSPEDAEPNNSTQLLKRALADVSPPYTDYIKQISPGTAWVSQAGSTSGHWYDYPSFGHSSAGINGVYGCTAVIISSEKGVYLSHIWENPLFIDNDWNPTSDSSFQTNAFNVLRDGNQYAQSVTALIGTDANPGVLHAIYAPKVFVLTPLTTQWDRDVKQITTRLRYQDRAQKLANDLVGIIPGSAGSGITLGYTRTSQQASTAPVGVAGRAILEVDPFQTWLTVDSDPTSPGLQVGRWRLWVEDQLITYQDFWLPNTTPPDGTIQQRDVGYANPCANLTGGSTSSSASKSASKTASSASKSSGTASSSSLKSSSASTLITTTRSSSALSSSSKISSSAVSASSTKPASSTKSASVTPSTTSKAASSSSTSAPLPTLSTTQCVTSSLINCQYVYFDASACPTTTQLLPASCTATSTSSSAAATTTAASCTVASDCPVCPLAGEVAKCTDGLCDCYTSIS